MATSDTQIFVALLGIIGVAVGAIVTYILTREREMALDKRQRTLERYDFLLTKLTDLLRNSNDGDKIHKFILAHYRAGSYATEDILVGCDKLLTALSKRENRRDNGKLDIKKVEDIIEDIYNKVRKELNPKAEHFRFRAWHVKAGNEKDSNNTINYPNP